MRIQNTAHEYVAKLSEQKNKIIPQRLGEVVATLAATVGFIVTLWLTLRLRRQL